MDACTGWEWGTPSLSLAQGWLDCPAWALGQRQYLHKGLLVDLQLRLWCFEVSGGEKTQEELPWDLALEANLQEEGQH